MLARRRADVRPLALALAARSAGQHLTHDGGHAPAVRAAGDLDLGGLHDRPIWASRWRRSTRRHARRWPAARRRRAGRGGTPRARRARPPRSRPARGGSAPRKAADASLRFLASLATTLSTSSSLSSRASSPATSAFVMEVRTIRSVPERTLSRGAHRVVEVVLEARLECRVGHAPSLAPGVPTGVGGQVPRRPDWVPEAPGLRRWTDGSSRPHRRSAPSAASSVPVSPASPTPRSWSARGSRCAGSPCPPCRPGRPPCGSSRCPTCTSRPGQAKKIAWVRDLAALEPDFVVNSGDNLAHVEAVPPLLRAMEPLMEFPGAFVLGLQRLLRPCAQEPRPLPHPPATPRCAPPAVRPARRRARRGPARRRLGRPRQRPHHGDDGRPPRRARRCRRPPRRLRPVCRGVRRPRPTTSRSPWAWSTPPTSGCSTRWSPTAPRSCSPGTPTAGSSPCPCGARSSRTATSTRAAPRVSPAGGPAPASAGRGGSAAPSSAAPDDAAWLHVSAGLGTSPYAPVRFACRPEATLLTLLARDA